MDPQPPECSGHSHDHDHDDDLGQSLRPYIDLSKVTCLNEEVQGSGVAILKLHENRLEDLPSLISCEGDPELLLYIPFTEAVSIQSIAIRGRASSSSSSSSVLTSAPPRRIKLFADRPDLDFEMARELLSTSTQQLELLPPIHSDEHGGGTIDYPLRPAGRFQNITALTIFVMDNFSCNSRENDTEPNGDDDDMLGCSTEITFVGLKGKGTNMRRGVVTAVYETQGVPKDHVVREDHGAPNVL